MSSRRSRSGGRRISTVLRRYNKSLRNRPAATSTGSSALVADTTRTSSLIVREEPSRSSSPSSSTRSSLGRSEEHTSELQSLMRISYAVFCLKNNNKLLHLSSHVTH